MAQEFSLTDAQLEAYRTAEVIFVAQDGYTLAPARVRAYNFAKACRDRGMRAEVLSFRDHLGGCAQGSGVHRMEDMQKLALIQRGAEILIQNPTAVLYMQKIGYHSVACAIASGRNGNRIVVDYDDFDFGVPLFPKLERFFLGLGGDPTTQSLMHAADLCVVSSRKLLEIVERFNPRVRLLSTGTDLAVFDAGLRDKAGRQPGDPVEIIWLGDIWGPQIIEDLILAVQAFSILPVAIRRKARFTVIGFGDFWPMFQYLIKEKFSGIDNIVLREQIAPAEVPELMARSDIGVLPLADTPFNQCKSPTKMFEYMAMKVAVCGTPVGEVAHILEDGVSGMLASDLAGFHQRLATLILDEDGRRRMTERAYERVLDGLHLGAIGDRLVDLLRMVQAEGPMDPFERNKKDHV